MKTTQVGNAWLCVLLLGAATTSAGPRPADSASHAGGIALLDAPSNLGLRPPHHGAEPGVRGLPDALRKTGFAGRLNVQDWGRVEAPTYSPDRELTTGFRNGPALARYSEELATRLTQILQTRQFVVVLGGDCSVLVGTGVALRSRGRFGLAFIDAHDDFSPPRDPSSRNGLLAAAGRDLGLATGFGPAQLTDIRHQRPYFRIEDVVHIGLSRESEDRQYFETERFDQSGIATYGIEAVKARGPGVIAGDALRQLESGGTDGFWVHLDVDVLDQTHMPAVDSPNPRGLTFEELEILLTRLLSSPKAVGMEVAIFDPTLDPSGELAMRLSGALERALVNSGRQNGSQEQKPGIGVPAPCSKPSPLAHGDTACSSGTPQ